MSLHFDLQADLRTCFWTLGPQSSPDCELSASLRQCINNAPVTEVNTEEKEGESKSDPRWRWGGALSCLIDKLYTKTVPGPRVQCRDDRWCDNRSGADMGGENSAREFHFSLPFGTIKYLPILLG